MKVNFYVEDMLFFKYIGCATVAKMLYRELASTGELEITWKGMPGDADLVHYHTFGPLAMAHRQMATGIRVLTAHSTPRINNGNIAFSKTINRFYPKIYQKFDHIITISESCHQEVIAMVPDVPATMIPNGVNRTYFRPDQERRERFRELHNIGDDERVVLTVAQMTPRKGIYDFCTMAKAHPEFRWVWVGGLPYGPFSKDYRQIKDISENAGDNVIFTGYVDEIADPYNGADLFLMPSHAETFGLVILEALASGLPVIARDIPEFREIFGDQVLYFKNPAGVTPLLRNDQLLRTMGAGSRAWTEKHDLRAIAEQHIALYHSLLEG
jgi:1,2-diacylglycerol-3-alpha-glucose alpha-1,2-galactosyltransferase